MNTSDNKTSDRKTSHIDLCLNEDVAFHKKSSGFEVYEFEHYAITELRLDEIELKTRFLGKKIAYPFMISSMTGGAAKAGEINIELARAAGELNIAIGAGSQRQALESTAFHDTYKVLRKHAPKVPILGNLGAAEIVSSKNVVDDIKLLTDLIEADGMIIHVNPLQELLQSEGTPDFKGLLKAIGKITSSTSIPLIIKEVGSGINRRAARELLNAGVRGIDVAGAGGTSWAAVELKRSGIHNPYFREWGLPTTYCIKEIKKLKKSQHFYLIASGGVSSGVEIAKSIALGADLAASARPLLEKVVAEGADGVIKLLKEWFDELKNVMYLTNCSDIKNLGKTKIKRIEEQY